MAAPWPLGRNGVAANAEQLPSCGHEGAQAERVGETGSRA